MKQQYKDIRNRANDSEPLWYDEHGTPRYVMFMPGLQSNIYANEVALFVLECQACGKRMDCVASDSKYDHILGMEHFQKRQLHVMVEHGHTGYGDPPAHYTPNGH